MAPSKAVAVITDQPQAKVGPNGAQSHIHMPGVEAEGGAIKGKFGPLAERHSRISVQKLNQVLHKKRIWFFAGHGDAMLEGDQVLAFEKDGTLEVVSLDTLVDIVRLHVQNGELKLVVLTGCCTARLGLALHERAGVPDVVCWTTKLEDTAGKIFGESFAETVAEQIMESDCLDGSAAFSAACAAVLSETEEGTLDNGLPSQVQKYQLHVDPLNTSLVSTRGRLHSNGRWAAGSPLHLSHPAVGRADFSIAVDGGSVEATPAFYGWCVHNVITVGGQHVVAEHVAKKLFIYHAWSCGHKTRFLATRDESGNEWSSVITREASGGGHASGLTYNDKPVVIEPVAQQQHGRRLRGS